MRILSLTAYIAFIALVVGVDYSGIHYWLVSPLNSRDESMAELLAGNAVSTLNDQRTRLVDLVQAVAKNPEHPRSTDEYLKAAGLAAVFRVAADGTVAPLYPKGRNTSPATDTTASLTLLLAQEGQPQPAAQPASQIYWLNGRPMLMASAPQTTGQGTIVAFARPRLGKPPPGIEMDFTLITPTFQQTFSNERQTDWGRLLTQPSSNGDHLIGLAILDQDGNGPGLAIGFSMPTSQPARSVTYIAGMIAANLLLIILLASLLWRSVQRGRRLAADMPITGKTGTNGGAAMHQVNQRLSELTQRLDAFVQLPSEEQWLQFFDKSPAGMCLTRVRDGRLIQVNEALLTMSGYSREEFMALEEFPLCPSIEAHGSAALAEPHESGSTSFTDNQGITHHFVFTRESLELHGEVCILTVAIEVADWETIPDVLKELEASYKDVFVNSHIVMLLLDPETGRIMEANPAAIEFYGYPEDALKDMLFERLCEQSVNLDELTHRHRLTVIQRDASGKRHVVDIFGSHLKLPEGDFDYLMLYDITSRVRAQTALRTEKEQVKTTLNAITDAVFRCDAERRMLFMNDAAMQLCPIPHEQAIGHPLPEILTLHEEEEDEEDTVIDLTELLDNAEQGELPQHLITRTSKLNGDEVIAQVSYLPISDEEEAPAGFVFLLHDITSLRQLSRKLSYEATHDPLTGLLNRREFETQLNEYIDLAKSGDDVHVLCYIDLDQFKVVNDTSGHRAGDALLVQIAELLTKVVRRADVVARLGGDEFGILLTYCTREVAESIVSKLIQSISAHAFTWNEREFQVGASVGMAIIDRDTKSMEEILSSADAACYLAKERGRNRYAIHAHADDTVIQRRREMEWIRLLHNALEKGDFQLHYQHIQPSKADPEAPLRIEILLRLLKPDGEIITPERFLPAADRFGMMPQIDTWVVRQVCKQLAELAHKYPLMIYINLANRSLADVSFAERIAESIEQTDMPADKLYFEISEVTALSAPSMIRWFNQTLKVLGCRFALDNYSGTPATIAHLKEIDFQQVKLGNQLSATLLDDPDGRATIEAVNQIAHTMGLETIAEYVSSSELAEAYRAIGVDYLQGYAVCGGVKPLESLEAVLQERFDNGEGQASVSE
ncbi:MAG: EAL domain-containing protein [Gammaproteobacteria bacterium]